MTRPTKAEFETSRELYIFKSELLELLAEHFGGQNTLNHLRVGNFIGRVTHFERRPTTNAEISRVLKLSRPTVSRIVGDFTRAGWVTEIPDPNDGRKRLLVIASGHPKSDRFERAFLRRVNELLGQYAKGAVIHVDPNKRMF